MGKTNDFSVSAYLDSVVHEKQLIKKIGIEASKKEQQAKELQQFFQDVKRYAKQRETNKDQGIGSLLDDEFFQMVLDTINLEREKQKESGKKDKVGFLKGTDSLLRRTHKSVVSVYDDIAEEEIAAIIKTVIAKSIGEKNVANLQLNIPIFEGETQGNIRDINIGKELLNENNVSEALSKIADKAGVNIKKKQENKESNPYSLNIEKRAIKTDISTVGLNIEAQPTEQWKKYFDLLKNSTFSIKNYQSLKYINNEPVEVSFNTIGLGNSNILKSLFGPLNYLGVPNKKAQKIVYKGLSSIAFTRKNANKKIQEDLNIILKHFYHLRFLYELAGVGLVSGQQFIPPVDFIIYNDPSTENIYVQNVWSIVKKNLEKQVTLKQTFGAITIPKAMFSENN